MSFVFLISVVILMPIFPVYYISDPRFLNHIYIYQFPYIVISLSIIRFRYYGAWAMAQSTISACGLSFGGYDNKNNELWDKVLTADPILELMPSPKDKIDVI